MGVVTPTCDSTRKARPVSALRGHIARCGVRLICFASVAAQGDCVCMRVCRRTYRKHTACARGRHCEVCRIETRTHNQVTHAKVLDVPACTQSTSRHTLYLRLSLDQASAAERGQKEHSGLGSRTARMPSQAG